MRFRSSRPKPETNSPPYDPAMMSRVGYWPRYQAGKRRETSSDLPYLGGITISRSCTSPLGILLREAPGRQLKTSTPVPTLGSLHAGLVDFAPEREVRARYSYRKFRIRFIVVNPAALLAAASHSIAPRLARLPVRGVRVSRRRYLGCKLVGSLTPQGRSARLFKGTSKNNATDVKLDRLCGSRGS